MQNSKDMAERYLNIAAEIIVILDSLGTITMLNESGHTLLGYEKNTLIGKNWFDTCLPKPMVKPVKDVFAQLMNGEMENVVSYENSIILRDGSEKQILWHNSILHDDNGVISGILTSGEDVSERIEAEKYQKKLEEQMQHAQKLESLGVLAGGIAHDFNNILTGILGNAEFAKLALAPESPILRNIKNIEKGAIHAADLTKQMLAYSGKGQFVIESINLNVMIDEMMHLLKTIISKKAILKLNLETSIPNIKVDVSQIRQIFMNLITNASEAIDDRSGIISISTGVIEVNKDYFDDTVLIEDLKSGYYSYFEVGDTGCGMDKETQSKIFDPFFTTKFTGRGLGLAAVLGIVRGHKGSMKVYSEVNKGTNFKVLFPCDLNPKEIIKEKKEINSCENNLLSGENKTVLIVDDDEHVRVLAKMILEEKNFTVLLAEDGREGIKVFKKHFKSINLVILDLTMPHVGGKEAAGIMLKIHPDAKILMSSGYNEQDIMAQFNGRGLSGFLQKPFGPTALCDKISEVL